jgi:RNA polymerase sigma-70 factor (ECF subfamily)
VTGDATFDRIVRTHGESLSRVAWGYARNDADHDDLMQEILVAIWRALPRFRGESSERTFVFRIAHNRGCTHSSERKRRGDEPESIPESVADQRPGPDEETDRALMRSRLVSAVRTLPELPRQAVLLRLEGFSIAEIAALQDTSENNVSVRLTRARDRLSELLGGGGR